MKKGLVISAIFGLLLLIAQGGIAAAEPTTYRAILGHYEEVRQALFQDSTDGVQEAARKIGERARGLEEKFEPLDAAVTEDRATECRENLPTIVEAASELQQASTLAQAREAFQGLSKAMIRYRQLVSQPDSVVVYCSMAEKIWIQPDEQIGNPYYGQSMARCGQVVSQ